MALRLHELQHRYGRQVVLDRVSLNVERGDCYGFLGHNGAGKTTTLRRVLGLIRTKGRVEIDGFDADIYRREARVRLGGLIEVPGFHGHWSGRANLAALARLGGRGTTKASKTAAEWLDVVGLGAVGRKPVRAYSQGMRQRLGIAQALIGNPDYLILDEPTNGLDPEGIAEIRDLLQDLRDKRELTILLSSHQLTEITGLCNRIGIIRQGKMLVEDSVENLLQAKDAPYLVKAEPATTAEALFRDRRLDFSSGTNGFRLLLEEQKPALINQLLVEAGCAVSVLSPERRTLESVYLEARTSSEDAALAAPAGTGQGVALKAPPSKLAPAFPVARVAAYEVRRWMRSVSSWLLMLTPAALGVFVVQRRAVEHQEYLKEVASGAVYSTQQVTAFEALGTALTSGLPLLAFILAGFASQSIASERMAGTLRNVTLRPVRRWQVGVGKALGILTFALAGYGILAFASYFAAKTWFKFEDLSEILPSGEPFPVLEADQLWPLLSELLRAPLAPLFAYAGLGFLAGNASRKGAAALGLSLVGAFLLDVLKAPGRTHGFQAWLPSAYLPSPLGDRTSFFQYYSKFVTNVGNVHFPLKETALSLPLAFGGIAFLIGILILVRRPVK